MIDLFTSWFREKPYSELQENLREQKQKNAKLNDELRGTEQLLIDREQEVKQLQEKLERLKRMHGDKTEKTIQLHDHLTDVIQKSEKHLKARHKSKPRRKEARQQLQHSLDKAQNVLSPQPPELVEPPETPEQSQEKQDELDVIQG